MLGFENRVSFHRCLLSVILGHRRCQAGTYKVRRVLPDRIHPLFPYICPVAFIQMKR